MWCLARLLRSRTGAARQMRIMAGMRRAAAVRWYQSRDIWDQSVWPGRARARKPARPSADVAFHNPANWRMYPSPMISESIVKSGPRSVQPGAQARASALLGRLRILRSEVDAGGQELLGKWESRIRCPGFRDMALNLAHYIILRRLDLRRLQDELMLLGLSSLGRLEGRVMANIDAVIAALAAIAGEASEELFPAVEAMLHGSAMTQANADRALGPCAGARSVRLMVTLPAEAASEAELARALIANGGMMSSRKFSYWSSPHISTKSGLNASSASRLLSIQPTRSAR